MVIGLGVHPFIITLGTMWMLRGLAFVISRAESIIVPNSLTAVAKAPLGMGTALYPVPLLVMLAVTILGMIYLGRTVMGRHVFAIGGNIEASRYSGLNVARIKLGVYVLSALTAGIAAFIGASFYGSATSSDGTGYELDVIAAAVVGGASIFGGRGTIIGTALGLILMQALKNGLALSGVKGDGTIVVIGAVLIAAILIGNLLSRDND
jgi:ribose transport system permease protein